LRLGILVCAIAFVVSCRQPETPQSAQQPHAPSSRQPGAVLNELPPTLEGAVAAGFKIQSRVMSNDRDMPGTISLTPSLDALRLKHCDLCRVGACVRTPDNKLNGWQQVDYWDCSGPDDTINHRPNDAIREEVRPWFEKKHKVKLTNEDIFVWRSAPTSNAIVTCACVTTGRWNPKDCPPGE
jgi:hypothetical protein